MSSKAIPFIGHGHGCARLRHQTVVRARLSCASARRFVKIYNICIIFPRSRLEADNTGDWGEID
jgi:hypothetical protein